MIGKLLWKPFYMTCDSPYWAFEGWVIPEVASFKEEGLVTKEGWDLEKGKLKSFCSKGELNPGLLHEMQGSWPLHHPEIDIRWSRLEQSVLWNKSSNITNPSLIQIEMNRYWPLELTYYYRTLTAINIWKRQLSTAIWANKKGLVLKVIHFWK